MWHSINQIKILFFMKKIEFYIECFALTVCRLKQIPDDLRFTLNY